MKTSRTSQKQKNKASSKVLDTSTTCLQFSIQRTKHPVRLWSYLKIF